MPTSLSQDICAALLQRMRDRVAAVRASAVRGLKRYQQLPTMRVAMAIAMRGALRDASVDVRLASVECILVTSDTVPRVVERLRDVDARVRRAAFATLALAAPLKKLAPEQRLAAARAVALERDATTRDAALTLVREQWLGGQCDNSVVQLLRALDVARDWRAAAVGAELLRALLPTTHVDAAFDSVEPLTLERALLWRVYCELFVDDPYLPEVRRFVELLREHERQPAIVAQLLQLCHQLDMADEAGRRLLGAQLRAMIPNATRVALSVVPHAVLLLRALVKDSDEYARQLLECVAELREPLDFGASPSKRPRLQSPPAMQLNAATATTASTTMTTTTTTTLDTPSVGERRRLVGWLDVAASPAPASVAVVDTRYSIAVQELVKKLEIVECNFCVREIKV